MTPHYADDWLTVYGGDCRAVLAELPAASVQCCVTSPPYWGLRDYGTATWIGGDEGCDHTVGGQVQDTKWEGAITTGQRPGVDASRCRKCGATRQDSQLGLEPTPEQYVANLVAVFREVRRVLRDDGTLWLNLGDSYAANRGNGASSVGEKQATNVGALLGALTVPSGLKPKDLVGIPWRVAFALQADGWYLRSDIIWAKPNPMPESVTDRPTKSHEYLFLLSKSARYYYDAEAVAETSINNGGRAGYAGYTARATAMGREPHGNEKAGISVVNGPTRNLRSVWTIATRPYPGAHFAVFPPELPERCIKAGSSERGVCPECGAPWERVVRATGETNGRDRKDVGDFFPSKGGNPSGVRSLSGSTYRHQREATDEWRVSCDCRPGRTRLSRRGTDAPRAPLSDQGEAETHPDIPAQPVPATILDPFAGSGTVGLVANRLSRRAILIDLNPAYIEQQMKRNAQVPVGL